MPMLWVSVGLLGLVGLGLLPGCDGCGLGGRAGARTHFASFEGGMIWRHCEPGHVEKWQVSRQALGLLAGAVAHVTEASPGVLAGAFAVLNYHMAHQMGREPKLAARLVPPARRRVVE